MTGEWIGSPNFWAGQNNPKYITMHIMAGSLQGTDRTFTDPSSQASSTYGVGADGTIHQYVSEGDAAWANGEAGSNCETISIEHAGGIESIPNTDACVEASARLCADIARRYGWPELRHGTTVRLHREIPPYLHPACPDICPNPLRWEEIIDKANSYLRHTSEIISTGDDIMAIVYGSDNFKGLKYWDGVNPPVGIQSQNHLSCLQTAYKAATGRDLPMLSFNGAWGVVFEQAAVAASQQRDWSLCQKLDDIKKTLTTRQ